MKLMKRFAVFSLLAALLCALLAPQALAATSSYRINGEFSRKAAPGYNYCDHVTIRGGPGPFEAKAEGVSGISSYALPLGLSVTSSGTNVTISGRVWASAPKGTYKFTLKVYDKKTNRLLVTKNGLSIKVGDRADSPALNITGSFGDATAGKSYSASMKVTNGTPKYTWSVSSGSLPDGLKLNRDFRDSSKATISGKLSSTAKTSTFTIEVKDKYSWQNVATNTFTINVSGTTPSNPTPSNPTPSNPTPSSLTINGSFKTATRGSYYSDYVTVSGGSTPYKSWRIKSGSLPRGLLLSYSGAKATVWGIPAQLTSVTSTFELEVTDSANRTASKQFTINVSGTTPSNPTPSSLTINGSFKAATRGSYYSDYVTVSGGTAPYTWSVISNLPPTGLYLSSSGTRATLSGTVHTSAATKTFTLQVKDSAGRTASKSFTLSISGLNIDVSLTRGISTWTLRAMAYGGASPYKWSVSPSSGLTLRTSGAAAVVSGSTASTRTFTLQVKDGTGATASKKLTVIGSARTASIASAADEEKPDLGELPPEDLQLIEIVEVKQDDTELSEDETPLLNEDEKQEVSGEQEAAPEEEAAVKADGADEKRGGCDAGLGALGLLGLAALRRKK